MNEFLSEENISLHREYVRKKQLELSILESSIPGLSGASVADIWHMRLTRRDRQDALALKLETLMHGIFFSSFSGVSHPRSEYVTRSFGSEAAFLNEVYKLALAQPYGFVAVFNKGRDIVLGQVLDARDIRVHQPVLAIDVCEHAYFADYGFDKRRYLVSALPYLDVTKLTLPTREVGTT